VQSEKPKLARVRLLAILGMLVAVPAAVASTHSGAFSRRVPTAEDLLRADSISSAIVAAESTVTSDSLKAPGTPLASMLLLPFDEKKNGRLGTYRLGYWPAEKGPVRSAAYANPAGFFEVTPANQNTYISDHFQLRDFLTHDQYATWPKYVVLREPLVDKLELVISDLQAHGIPVQHVQVMSGFRAPEYNQLDVRPGGRVADSRHQYGDAADVFVDNNRDQRMDDLNRDGQVDVRDARVILQAVERVERANPSLIGGAGLYTATSSHGPFIHIDARGTHARWGGA